MTLSCFHLRSDVNHVGNHVAAWGISECRHSCLNRVCCDVLVIFLDVLIHNLALFECAEVTPMLDLAWFDDKSSLSCNNEVVGGYIGFTPSICLSVRPSVPHPVSALERLQFWLDPFHIYTSHEATSYGVSLVKFLAKFQKFEFLQFFKIYDFHLVWFWLGIWSESLVWLIMGGGGGGGGGGVGGGGAGGGVGHLRMQVF